jgi:endonuclease YncB( thermonuclease family)
MADWVFDNVTPVRVIDGDTFWLRVDVDVGFRQHSVFVQEFRLGDADCPEKHKGTVFERAEAGRAQTFTAAWLTSHTLAVRSEPDPDSFGRWLGYVWDQPTGVYLVAALAEAGLATTWPTRWRDVYDRRSGVEQQ